MKKINYKRLLALTVFTLINGYSVSQISANAELYHCKRNTNTLQIEEITAPTPDAPTPDAQTTEPTIQWETTNVLVRALRGQWCPVDDFALQILNMPSVKDNFMQGLLAIFLNPTIIPTPITEETSDWFESARQNISIMTQNNHITRDQATICTGLLPDATVEELFESAEKILEIEPTYVKAAIKCFTAIQNHPDATVEKLFESAEKILKIAPRYVNAAIMCFTAIINRPDATVEKLFESAEKILEIEPTYVKAAIKCFTAIINHPYATVEDLIKSAEKILKIAPRYVNAATMCFKAIINHSDATVEKLFESAEKILKIAPRYVNAAIKCFTAIINHSDATVEDLIKSAEKILKIAPRYVNAATMCFKAIINHPDATVEDLFDSAEKILEIAPGYVNAAIMCFTAIQNHPDATVEDLITAGQEIIDIGEEYHTLGTDMLLLAAERPEIKPNQIEEIIDELTLLIDMSPEIIEQLCHQLFNHPKSSRINKIQAADYLQNLGIHHYKQVSKKLNQLLDITNDSAFIAMKIGETFEKMGKEYYASALNAFNKSASIPEIASEDSPLINQCLARINEKIANLSNQ